MTYSGIVWFFSTGSLLFLNVVHYGLIDVVVPVKVTVTSETLVVLTP